MDMFVVCCLLFIDLQHENCYCVLGSSIWKVTDLEALARKAQAGNVFQGVLSYAVLPQSTSQLFINGLIYLLLG